jgi:tetratricopeptide (TPR) repeat protein
MNLLATLASIILATSAPQLHLSNDQQLAVLQEAQFAYDNGIGLQLADPAASKNSFKRAANRFQVLVDDGVENGKLWYNLGNAQLQSENIGEAIAAYRMGQRYIPSNGRIAANLQFARSLVSDSSNSEDTISILRRLAFWHDTLPTQVRLTMGIIFWTCCWSLISIRLFRAIPGFKTASITLGIAALALSVSVTEDFLDQHREHGVLIEDEVTVRKGNGEHFAPMFIDPIQEGIEFTIIEQRPDWLHIKLPNGSTGWILEKNATIVSIEKQNIRI